MLSQQIKNELPADLIMTIMQYACYKTHDTAKMIKQAVEDEHELKQHLIVSFRLHLNPNDYPDAP